MPILMPTKDTGATTKPSEMLYVEPSREMTDEALEGQMDLPDGLNGAFIADLLSGMLTHERCGHHLYLSVAERTNNPMLKGKYQQFGKETERHAEILQQLITRLGGSPTYVSPMARAIEGTDTQTLQATFLLSGSIDVLTQEMAMLDAVFLAESMDHANWQLLGDLRDQMPDGGAKDAITEAVAQAAPEEDEHLTWARNTKARMVSMQAQSSTATTAMMKTEELIATVRGWFSS